MANLYGEIAAKSLLTLDKSFARANGQPLDASEVYYSLSAAQEYARGAQAYVGQKIVVVENGVVTHYSISDAAGNLKELGSKPVGDESSITVAENGTVSLAGIGTLVFERDILGEDGEPTGEKEDVSYQPLMTKSGLIWIEPSKTTVEGLATLIDALTQRVSAAETDIAALKAAVGKEAKPESSEGAGDGEAATGLYLAIANEIVRATAAEAGLRNSINSIDFVDESELSDAIKDFATKDFVASEIGKVEIPVTGVSATDNVLTLGDDKNITATISLEYDSDAKSIKLVGKNNADLGSIDATPFIKDGMLDDVSYDAASNTLTFTWNTDSGKTTDTVVLSDIIEPYTAGAGITLSGNEFSVKVDSTSETFLTVGSDGVKLSGVQAAINTAAQSTLTSAATNAKTKADQALADAKADAANIYATKSYVGNIPTNEDGSAKATNVIAYIEAKAAEVLDQATGGTSESAASVKGQLDTFKAEINPKVQKNITDIATNAQNISKNADDILNINNKLQDIEESADANVIETIKVNNVALTPDSEKAVNITVPTKFTDLSDDSGFDTRITAAQNKADAGVSAASTAQATANDAKTAAENNAKSIGEINGTLESHTKTLSDHGSEITSIKDQYNTHLGAYETLAGIVGGHTTTLATKADATALDEAKASISANATAIKSINETTIPAINTEIGKKANAEDVYTKNQTDAIIGTPTSGKTIIQMISDAQAAATYDDTAVKASIKANTDAITVLNGEANQNGSVAHTVATELAKILNDNDDTDIDTLEEIAAWIANDTTGAAKMNKDIAANTGNITTILGQLKTLTEDKNTSGSILNSIDTHAKVVATGSVLGHVLSTSAENGIAVDATGVMSVNNINVNKLVQTSGDTLILNGGSATV